MNDFDRIAEAISYLREHFREQPKLEDVASHVFVSPYHFQRMFKQWVGITPKKFLQFISLEHAKSLLDKENSVFDATYSTGLSSTSRLHDLFINIERMTPGEYRNGAANLNINYATYGSVFGEILIGSTPRGICCVTFIANKEIAISQLKSQFPRATFSNRKDTSHQPVVDFFAMNWQDLPKIKLHLKGSPFQIKVWQALLQIPFGQLNDYQTVARKIGQEKSFRAVGNAIGKNPIAFLIPCHRVIRSNGVIGQYRWGSDRKTAMIGWESARVQQVAVS